MKKKTLLTAGMLLVLLFAAPLVISAHDMWAEMESFTIKPGAVMKVLFPSDHTFPAKHGEFIPADQMTATYLVSPNGGRIKIIAGEKSAYKSVNPLTKEGTYCLISGKKWRYWTQTTTGWEEGKNKAQVSNAVKGVKSIKFAKALVVVGKAGGAAATKTYGQELEIVLLADPGNLKEKSLAVKILFKGKPLSAEIKATYAGFSSKENEFAVKMKSGFDGKADIPLKKKGKWLVSVTKIDASKDKKLCDELMYAATLTFELR